MKHTTKSNIHNSFATKDIIGTISAFFYEIISIRTSIDICIVIFLFFFPPSGYIIYIHLHRIVYVYLHRLFYLLH